MVPEDQLSALEVQQLNSFGSAIPEDQLSAEEVQQQEYDEREDSAEDGSENGSEDDEITEW